MLARVKHSCGEKVRTKFSEVRSPDISNEVWWGFNFVLCFHMTMSLCLLQVVMPGSTRTVEVDEVEDLSQLE